MTTTAFVVAMFGLASGRPIAEVALIVAAFGAPQLLVWGIPIVVLRTVREIRGAHGSDVLTLVALSAELRAGSTLRSALISASEESPSLAHAAALARAGRPMPVVFDAAAGGLGRYGALSSAALGMAASTGGSAVAVVDQLVAQVMALDELERERRAAMAPILLQAAIVGGVPSVSLVAMALSGRLLQLAATGSFGAALVAAGSGLVIVGTVLVLRIASRTVRT